jgi:hypothetical protein
MNEGIGSPELAASPFASITDAVLRIRDQNLPEPSGVFQEYKCMSEY